MCKRAPLTSVELKEQFERGPHESANKCKEFIREEIFEFCEKGFFVVLPFDQVKDLPNFYISPLGAKEERERRLVSLRITPSSV